jgi:hypothetical protein
MFRCCKLSELTRHIATSKHNKPNAEKTPNITLLFVAKNGNKMATLATENSVYIQTINPVSE